MLPHKVGRFLLHFMKKQKFAFIAIQIFALGWTIDNTVWPYAFKLLLDKLLNFHGDKTHIWVYLWPTLLFWAGLWVSIEIMFRVMGFIAAVVMPRFEAMIRMAMFRYVLQHSFDYFANNLAGNLSNKISDMVQSSTRVLQLIITLFIPAGLSLLIATGVFYTVNHWFAALLFSWVCLHMGICYFGGLRCSELADLHSTKRSFLTGKIVDTFTNVLNVKVFARNRYERSYIYTHQQEEQAKQQHALVAAEKIKVALGISSFIFPGVLMTWYQVYCWQHGIIGIGDLALIFNTTLNITFLAWISGLELPNFFKEIGICRQALQIIRDQHDLVDAKDAKRLQLNHGEILFDKVNFAYLKNQNQAVFNDLSVRIDAGSKVGLVGFSGSGKTSFVNLIMRFYDIDSGHIYIDGQDIAKVTQNSLHESVSMIPQMPVLFHRSLAENIAYGKLDATEAEIIAASQQAYCHDFIEKIPEGYAALVGERGIKLSGGQRQRIAIARAILENGKVLILDEATSALDSVTEGYIQEALTNIMQGRTTIVVAHRLATLAKMDRILVFDNGRIVEDGKHEDLLKANAHYAKMWAMQAGGFLPTAWSSQSPSVEG